MIIYMESDAHLSFVRRQVVEAFMEEAGSRGDIYLSLGDRYDAARYGWKKIAGSGAIQWDLHMLETLSKKIQVKLITGNHDWGLPKVGLIPQGIPIYKNYTFTDAKYTYLATHGWEWDWTISWTRAFYARVFPWLPFFAPLYDKLFTSPGKLKVEDPRSILYWRSVLTIDKAAMLKAIMDNVVVLYGHTHNWNTWHFEDHLVLNSGTALEPDHYGIIIEDGVPRMWKR